MALLIMFVQNEIFEILTMFNKYMEFIIQQPVELTQKLATETSAQRLKHIFFISPIGGHYYAVIIEGP